MKPSVLFLINIIKYFIPETRGFRIKRSLYRVAGVKVGKNVRICSSVKIRGNGNLSIGDNTWIGHETLIISSSSILIGSDNDIAPKVYIGTGTHQIDILSPNIAGKGISKDVIINNGCWICVGSIILPGVKIGNKSIIAAGAVVSQTIPDFTIVGGIPAKVLKRLK